MTVKFKTPTSTTMKELWIVTTDCIYLFDRKEGKILVNKGRPGYPCYLEYLIDTVVGTDIDFINRCLKFVEPETVEEVTLGKDTSPNSFEYLYPIY